MRRFRKTSVLVALLVGLGLTSDREASQATFTAEIWADNWFSIYVGEQLVLEDPVPITTERSFNAESVTFEAEYPFTVSVVARDFIENDTGLEYIGRRNQQAGDGGFIMQVSDTPGGTTVAVTDSDWSCLVVHRAPINPECVSSSDPESDCQAEIRPEPEGWKLDDFDASGWEAATEFTEAQVSPRGGYDQIDWDPAARLIWSSDLVIDNTLLCRTTVTDGRRQEPSHIP